MSNARPDGPLSAGSSATRIALHVVAFALAAYVVIAYGLFPLGATVHPDMRASFQTHPAALYLHAFGSMVALVTGTFQFSPRLRTHRPALHRWLGRAYLGIGVLAGGLSGLYLAPHAYGGLVSQLGFGALAVAWLFTGSRAWMAIRRRDIPTHRFWMTCNFGLTLAAVTLRLWLPALVVAGTGFATAYPLVAWLCWVPNLFVAIALARRDRTHAP